MLFKIQKIIEKVKDKLNIYKNAFITDITYIYNLNELEELKDLTPAKRLLYIKRK